MSYHGWLQQVVAPYADPGRTFREVDMSLVSFPMLKPKTDHFTRNGPPQLLICLFGSLPLAGGIGAGVEVWLPRIFPHQPPMVYLIPLGNVSLRATQNVDLKGMVYHPYLAYWSQRPGSNIVELLRVLMAVFAADPPIIPIAAQQSRSPALSPTPATTVPQKKSMEQELVEARKLLNEKLNEMFASLQQDLTMESDKLLGENTLLSKGADKLKEGLTRLKLEIVCIFWFLTKCCRERQRMRLHKQKPKGKV